VQGTVKDAVDKVGTRCKDITNYPTYMFALPTG